MKNIIEKIYDYSLEEIMGERFGPSLTLVT